MIVCGPSGSGRHSIVESLLRETQKDATHTVARDLLYVNNFHSPEFPRFLSLPAGQGAKFKKFMKETISHVVQQLEENNRNLAKAIIERGFGDIGKLFSLSNQMEHYLNEVKASLLERSEKLGLLLEPLRQECERQRQQKQLDLDETHIISSVFERNPNDAEKLREYEVNLLVDNGRTEGCPIVLEHNPSFKNLFGMIEQRSLFSCKINFADIRAGSLLRANGGFLVISVDDAFLHSDIWPLLKRCLRENRLEITNENSLLSASSMKPEAIPIDVKVVMIGSNDLYSQLSTETDTDDFEKLFKVKVQFDNRTLNDHQTLLHYVAFVKRVCIDENLLPFSQRLIAHWFSSITETSLH